MEWFRRMKAANASWFLSTHKHAAHTPGTKLIWWGYEYLIELYINGAIGPC